MLINKYTRQIKRKLKRADEIYIMGHRHLDLDALGACLGMYEYARKIKKTAYVIIDDSKLELSCEKVIDKVRFGVEIITSEQMNDLVSNNSVLVIVDTNKKSLVQNDKIIDYFENVIVVDHHDMGEDTINKGLVLVDTKSSSACEMVVDFLLSQHVHLNSDIATYLLSGIVLDTNNFVVKSTANTFKVVHLLTELGASPKRVQYLLKQDLKEYIERQKVITDVKVIGKIAFTKGLQKVVYKREDLAKIADTLLFFNKIEASFVMGRISKDEMGISARSMGNINVGKIMSRLGGGGNPQEAATKFKVAEQDKIESKLIEIIELL